MNRLNYIIAALLSMLYIASVQATPQSNLQILEQAYFDLCQDILQSISLTDSSCVIDTSTAKTDYNWLIEKQFFTCLTQAGVKHVYNNAHIENASHISFKSVGQRIFYQRVAQKKVERTIEIKLHVRYVDSKKTILNDKVIVKTLTDTLATKDIKNVEDIKFPFTIGDKDRSLFKKIYEPLLVTLVTGWIIYLFYSYRSQ